MDDERPLPSRAPLPDISGDRLNRLLLGDDPALTAAIADLVELVHMHPERTLAGWNSFLETRPISD